MTSTEELSEFHKRLENFDSRLKKKTRQLEAERSRSRSRRKDVDAIHAKAAALRRKLRGTSPSSWGAIKKELETEWNILSHSFERWASHVDTDFQHRRR